MATLNRIREKSGVLIAIIGFALFAFVLGDLFKSGSSILKGDQFVVGVIDGNEIVYQEFHPEVQRTLEAYKRQGMNSQTQVSNIVWNNMERKILVDGEVEKLGLNIGEDELWHLIINDPSIRNAPGFQTQQGIFDENRVKEYLTYLRENADKNAEAAQLWYEWINFEKLLKERGIVQSYYNLISSGISATEVDGKYDFKFQNDQVDAKYVYLPYSSVNDAEVKIEDSEISSYVEDHEEEFKLEAGRDIQYVYYQIKPSLTDEAKAKEEILELLNDKVEYNNRTNSYDTIPGFATTGNNTEFVNQKSDERFDATFYHKGKLPEDVENFAFNASKGDIYGPYLDGSTYKVSKLVDTKVMPDSVKASHILIAFAGSQGSSPDVTRNEEQAKIVADSLSKVLNKNSSQFADLAKEFSDGPTSAQGGDLGWFTYGRMVPEFNDFVFENKKGSVGVVKTVFGYHVIKIEDQKNISEAVQLATLVRNIVVSDETDNEVYAKASKFAKENQSLESFRASAEAKGMEARPVEGLKIMESNIPGIGDQREIVKWSFNEETMIGDTRLFNVSDGYIVVLLYGKSEEGLLSTEEARPVVEPILINEKKAEILLEKINGNTLAEIAKNAETTVRSANSIHFENPIIPGAGREPKVVGELFGMKKGEISMPLKGNTGVFVMEVVDVKEAAELPNYASYTKRINSQYSSRVNSKVFEALKSSVVIEDRRSKFY